ncbi:MAG: putative primosomal replication protein [Polaromonas sp.]|nr:putative primosomal replication protein [Polaromonas sp.]
MNQVELTASIAELSALRYTPAGIPAINFILEHESEKLEAGMTRQVKLTIKAVTFGMLAEQALKLPLGKALRFTGFLINARTSKGVVFHIQALHPITQAEQVLNPI